MKHKSRIEKGKRAEKECARRIELAGLGRARREVGSGSGKNKGDIFANIPFLLEVKNQKTIRFMDWVEQAKEQARIGNYNTDKWGLVIVNPRGVQYEDRMEMFITIEFDQFLKLLKKNKEPTIKEPDKEMKYKLYQLKTLCNWIEKRL